MARKHKNHKLIAFAIFAILLTIFLISSDFLFKLTTKIYPIYYNNLFSTDSVRLSNGIIFTRHSESNRAGIWFSDLEKNSEKQLISYEELIGTYDKSRYVINDYFGPVVSPDKTKMILVLMLDEIQNGPVETSSDKYIKANVYLYDIKSNKIKTLLNDVNLLDGYAQTPVWNNDSNTILLSFKKQNKNEVYLVNLFGFSRKINSLRWTSLYGQFNQRFLNQNYIIYNYLSHQPDSLKYTYLGSTGVFDINKDKVYDIVNLNINTYNTTIMDSELIASLSTPVMGRDINFSPDEINGLIKYNLSTNNLEKYNLPINYSKPKSFERLGSRLVCANWTLLYEKINENSKLDNLDYRIYLYNLKTGENIDFINPKSFYTHPVPNCDNNKHIQMLTDNDIYDYDLSTDDLKMTKYNYSDILNKKVSGLYENGHNLYGQKLFIDYIQGFGPTKDSSDPGIYYIDLNKKFIKQITITDSKVDSQDIFVEYIR